MGITLNDIGEVVRQTQGYIEILNALIAGRSAIFQIDNKTKITLKLVSHADTHGGTQETPPLWIPPGAGVFSAQSTALVTGTGTEGSATYAGAGFYFTVYWKIPYIGPNEARADITGLMGARYARHAIHGVGTQKVHMHYELNANVLDYSTIPEKYQALISSGLSLGNPVGMEVANPDNVGRRQDYEHGVIYWSPSTTAHEVHGLIRDKWTTLGRENYGYPVSDELSELGGKSSHFQRFFGDAVFGGSIYYSEQTGRAHEVQGLIREAWWGHGGAGNWLGFPVADEEDWPQGPGRLSRFQHGSISWNRDTGVINVISA
jgi:LGFP repeat